MFTVERTRASAEIREQSEIDGIINELTAAGHKPVLRSMVGAARKAATLPEQGLGVEMLAARDPRFRTAGSDVHAPVGDLLFTTSENVADRCYFVQPFHDRLFVFEIRHHCVPSGLQEFCGAVERAIRARVDGRRVRGMDFTWHTIKEKSPRPTAGSSRFPDTPLKTKKPEYSDEELRAAKLLVAAEPRNMLLQLAQIGKIRAADAKIQPLFIKQLLEEHLISKEYLVVCKKDSRTLCQIVDIKYLTEDSGSKLTCATCGRKFNEELVHEIFAVTDMGKQLIAGSRWMTIWLTDMLVQAGLAKEEIAWSATAGDDEIDIMTDELGLRILFELKDREFGLGDAYPFAYRVDRYGGNVGIVVSTERVAAEAEKFFQEQRSKAAASIETAVGETIEPVLRALIDKYSRVGVQQVLTNLAGPLGLNIAPLVNSWMEMFALAFRAGRYKPPTTANSFAENAGVTVLQAKAQP